MTGLLQAVEIEKGNITLVEREGMPDKTYYVPKSEEEKLNKLIKHDTF